MGWARLWPLSAWRFLGLAVFSFLGIGASQSQQPANQVEVLPRLTEGRYQITELISGDKLGEFSSEQLGAAGVPCPLKQHEVAIYRMELLKN